MKTSPLGVSVQPGPRRRVECVRHLPHAPCPLFLGQDSWSCWAPSGLPLGLGRAEDGAWVLVPSRGRCGSGWPSNRWIRSLVPPVERALGLVPGTAEQSRSSSGSLTWRRPEGGQEADGQGPVGVPGRRAPGPSTPRQPTSRFSSLAPQC